MNKAESLKFEEIEIGTSRSFDVTVTAALVEEFARLSGDFNPLHTDSAFAEKTKFKKRVVHGFLLGCFLSRLVGMHLPGENALYLSQTLNFRHPAFENDRLRVEGSVVAKSEALKLLTIKTVIAKASGEIVLDGEAKVSCLEG